MTQRERKTLSFLTIGEQIRVERSCDFRMETAFPENNGVIKDIESVQRMCKAASEVTRMLYDDARCVQEAKNDVKAMIDDWKATDDQLECIASKIGDIVSEHSPDVSASADEAADAIAKLRDALARDASHRVTQRCMSCEMHASRLQFVRINTPRPTDAIVGPDCSICWSLPVRCALLPCGHCFCAECADRAGEQCYVCRAKVSRIANIFY